MMKALSIIATTIACLIYALASVSAPAAELDAYGETRVPFGGEIEGAGQQGERDVTRCGRVLG
jgi:hypothetical protein